MKEFKETRLVTDKPLYNKYQTNEDTVSNICIFEKSLWLFMKLRALWLNSLQSNNLINFWIKLQDYAYKIKTLQILQEKLKQILYLFLFFVLNYVL